MIIGMKITFVNKTHYIYIRLLFLTKWLLTKLRTSPFSENCGWIWISKKLFLCRKTECFFINKVHQIVGSHSFRNSTNSFFILFHVQSEKQELMSIRQWSLNKITAWKHRKAEWCVSLHQKAMLTRKITRIIQTVYAVLCSTCHCSIKYIQLTKYLTNYWKIW